VGGKNDENNVNGIPCNRRRGAGNLGGALIGRRYDTKTWFLRKKQKKEDEKAKIGPRKRLKALLLKRRTGRKKAPFCWTRMDEVKTSQLKSTWER